MIIKIAFKGDEMSRPSHLRVLECLKREMYSGQLVTSIPRHPGPCNCLALGLSFPGRVEAEVSPKGEGHADHSDGRFSGHCSTKHALGRWPPCHAPRRLYGLEILLCSFLRMWPELLGSQTLRFSMETGLILSGVHSLLSLARATREGSFSLPTSSSALTSASGGRGVPEASWNSLLLERSYAMHTTVLILISIFGSYQDLFFIPSGK